MRKDKVKPKKVQLTEQSKAALSESKLAKMWAKQVTTKTEETNSRGLKRKLFNLEGSVRKAGRVDTICVCPCVCPADRVGGNVNNMIICKEDEQQHQESEGGAMECSSHVDSAPSQEQMDTLETGGGGSDDNLDAEMPSQTQTIKMMTE